MQRGLISPLVPAVPRLGPIIAVTVTSADVGASLATYGAGLGYAELARGVVTSEQAAAWGAASVAGRDWALAGPPPGDGGASTSAEGGRVAGAPGAVRFVESRRPPGYLPLRHTGWAALEIAVQDVEAVAAGVEAAGFRVLRRPQALSSTTALRAMQVCGPDGEVVYLTQQLRHLDAFELPVPTLPVDGVFVAVLAARDLEVARAFYEQRFAVRRASDHPVAIKVLNDSFGLPDETAHRLSSLQLAGECLLEIDQYPAAATPRHGVPGELPPGVAVVTLAAGNGAGREFFRCEPLVVHGAEGELVELVGLDERALAGGPAPAE
jgi:catechol 2,3-dioxygenase-like lactoylglutathione lyase family enzyme